MTESGQARLPIGYWLKKADEVLTARINEVQRVQRLARTEWQILNSLHEVNQATRDQLAALLHPFADAAVFDDTVLRLTQRRLIEESSPAASRLQLTRTGQELHRAALSAQQAVRQRAVQGISESDYLTTVRVLQQLVENLREDTAHQGASAAHQ